MGKSKRKREIQNKSEILKIKETSVLKNLLTLNKSNGLIVGTNSILRNLEKGNLSAVFICSDKACVSIFRAISFWCKETDVPLFTIEAEERHYLNSEIPVSVTYGIKKDSMHLHRNLEEGLKEIKSLKTQKNLSSSKLSVNSDDIISILPKKVPMEQKEEKNFVCHKKHSSLVRKSKTDLEGQKDFLALCSSSDSDDDCITTSKYRSIDSEFPDYRTPKWKDSDLVVK